MQISETQDGEAMVLELEGRFDFGARKVFKDTIDRMQQKGCTNIILNMEQVSFIDSSALGLLVIAHQNLKVKHAKFSVVNPQPYVRQVLDLANIPKMISVVDSVEEAKLATTQAPVGTL